MIETFLAYRAENNLYTVGSPNPYADLLARLLVVLLNNIRVVELRLCSGPGNTTQLTEGF